MAKTAAKNAKKGNNSRKGKAAPQPPESPPPTWQRRLGQEMAALLLLGLAGFGFLALISFNLSDPQGLIPMWNATGVENRAGKAGALLSAYLIWSLGAAAFFIPLILLGLAWESRRRGLEELSWVQALAGLGVLLAGSGLLSLMWPRLHWGEGWIHSGGRLGDLLAAGLLGLLNPTGAVLALALLFLISLMGVTRLSYVGLTALMVQGVKKIWGLIWRGTEAPETPAKPRAPRRPVITKNGRPEEVEVPAPPVSPPVTPEPAPRRRAGAAGKFILPPLDLLDTDVGTHMVERILVRLEHGVVS